MLATSSLPFSLSFPPPASPPGVNVGVSNINVNYTAAPSPSEPSDNNIDTDHDDVNSKDEDSERKKTYLSLLPPAQIIELCLTFEQHIPAPLRASLWPADLESAILALQKVALDAAPPEPPSPDAGTSTTAPESAGSTVPVSAANVPSQQVHPPGDQAQSQSQPFNFPLRPLDASFPISAPSTDVPPVVAQEPPSPTAAGTPAPQPEQTQASTPDTLPQDLSVEPQASSQPQNAAPAAPQGVPTPQTQTQAQAHTPTPQTQVANTPAFPTPPAPTTTYAPASTSAPTATPVPAPVPTPYPYAPYGYPHQPYPQAAIPPTAYPHAPYYPPPVPSTPSHAHTHTHTTPSPYAYPGYPGYPPPAGYPIPPVPPPQEDLPSYEDMLVEALMDMDEQEGAAPRDLFLWMAQRWPLQINFRPSASQALQKAFKRGRFEKLDNGKYRLSPNWEGGATSKRTTRRPQTLAQTTYAMHHPPAPPSSPFTHAPLARGASATAPPQPQAYPGYTYPYAYPAYPGYPGYPPHPHASRPSISTSKAAASAASSAAAGKSGEKAASAQNKEKDKEKAADATAVGDEAGDAWEAAQHILKAINFGLLQNELSAVLASAVSSGSGTAATTEAEAEDGLGTATLTDEERASLQAQLALLAAQLSEIAEMEAAEEEEERAQTQPPTQPPTPPQARPQAFPQMPMQAQAHQLPPLFTTKPRIHTQIPMHAQPQPPVSVPAPVVAAAYPHPQMYAHPQYQVPVAPGVPTPVTAPYQQQQQHPGPQPSVTATASASTSAIHITTPPTTAPSPTPQRIIIDVNQFPEDGSGGDDLMVIGEGEELPTFDLEAAVNSIVNFAAQAEQVATSSAVVAMDVDPLAPPGDDDDSDDEDMEMVC